MYFLICTNLLRTTSICPFKAFGARCLRITLFKSPSLTLCLTCRARVMHQGKKKNLWGLSALLGWSASLQGCPVTWSYKGLIVLLPLAHTKLVFCSFGLDNVRGTLMLLVAAVFLIKCQRSSPWKRGNTQTRHGVRGVDAFSRQEGCWCKTLGLSGPKWEENEIVRPIN